MRLRRRESGILLHVTSLPGDQGIGNFGPAAYRFVDFLDRTRQQLWQVLPLGPTGYGNSPYQSFSAFAGNPLLISLESLAEEGLLDRVDMPRSTLFPADRVNFDDVALQQTRLLGLAHERFQTPAFSHQQAELAKFAEEQAAWLNDYALFQAIKWAHGGVAWTSWEPQARDRDPEALNRYQEKLRQQIELEKFTQFKFYSQWRHLKRYANERGISIIGDLPIFVAHDSADVWVSKDQFYLNPDGKPQVVAGVPPDYFSATGQLWGNPIYRWDKMAAEGYAWWIKRIRGALQLFDRIRIDHFRGFESYWEVPGDATVASGGRWVPGPGAALFEAAQRALGPLPIIAEDLGVITPQVDALRDQLGFPGMRVLQFAFGDDPKARDYQPHNYPRECLVYTGTHDNDTMVGWFASDAGAGTTREQTSIDRERQNALRYLDSDGRNIHWHMIRLALASVANTAIFPMQDLLGLGSEARMNLPGTSSGNWAWRFSWEMLTPEIEQRLKEITETYERAK
jgi:4-alpha-glucanotransferase